SQRGSDANGGTVLENEVLLVTSGPFAASRLASGAAFPLRERPHAAVGLGGGGRSAGARAGCEPLLDLVLVPAGRAGAQLHATREFPARHGAVDGGTFKAHSLGYSGAADDSAGHVTSKVLAGR